MCQVIFFPRLKARRKTLVSFSDKKNQRLLPFFQQRKEEKKKEKEPKPLTFVNISIYEVKIMLFFFWGGGSYIFVLTSFPFNLM